MQAGDHPLAAQAFFSQTNATSPIRRWRASKGSAPVNRFTRAIKDNVTEGWHRTMPVAGGPPAPVSRGVVRATRTPREQRRAPRAQVVRRRNVSTNTQTVAVPASVVRSLAVAPTRTAGTATVAAPATTVKLVAVAPSVSLATQVAVPSSRITLNAVAPARTATVTRAVPAVAVRDIAVAPTVVPGTRAITPTPVAIRLLAVAPQVQNFILVPAASLRLGAVAPSVTGGGGGGGTVTLRKSGD